MENKNKINGADLALLNNKDLLKKALEQSFISGHRPAQMCQKHGIQIISKKVTNTRTN